MADCIATGARMKYEAYQAHADIMAHMRLYTEAALNAMRQPWLVDHDITANSWRIGAKEGPAARAACPSRSARANGL